MPRIVFTSTLTRGIPLVLALLASCTGDGDFWVVTGGGLPEDETTGAPGTTGELPGTTGAPETTSTTGYDPMAHFDVAPPLPSSDAPVPGTCLDALKNPSSMGCLFYALDLDRLDNEDEATFAIAVANVHDEGETAAVVEVRKGTQWYEMETIGPLGPGEVELLTLPDRHYDSSGWSLAGAYRVIAERPVTVYQWNGLDPAPQSGGDVSLLTPASSFTSSYEALGRNTTDALVRATYVAIIASVNGTEVTIYPTAETLPGNLVTSGGPDQPIKVTLDEGDVAQIATAPSAMEVQHGLAGTRVESGGEHPIAVLTGHACAAVPSDETVCDYMEEQVSPHLYGEQFLAPRLPLRDLENPEHTLWQIYALVDNTTVTVDGETSEGGPQNDSLLLQAGEIAELWITGPGQHVGDVEIQADHLISVTGYITNATDLPGGTNLGGPGMVQLAPVDRYLSRYVIYAPPGWDRVVAVITRPTGAETTIDDALIDDAASPIGDGFEVLHVPLEGDALYTLRGDDSFGVVLIGYGPNSGFATIGGWGTPLEEGLPPR
ncbi:MAG: IgGFc-binding protein [Myxococcales bacterium]|nr:IgGFc-binding protein [Myxococcales bacterium]